MNPLKDTGLLPFATALLLAFAFLPTRAAEGFRGDLCNEGCREKATTENQACTTTYDTCASACPDGWAGKACLVPCRASRTSCERKVSERQTACANTCKGAKK